MDQEGNINIKLNEVVVTANLGSTDLYEPSGRANRGTRTVVNDLYRGITFTEDPSLGKGAGITTPLFGGIRVYSLNDIALKQHEYGHFLYVQRYGIFNYYLGVAPASIISAWLEPWGPHNKFWTERIANEFAEEHFGSSLAPDFKRRFPSK